MSTAARPPRSTGAPATPPSRAAAASTGLTAPSGISRLSRIIGSQVTVPARSSAASRTSGVSLRKWAAVVDGET